MIHDVQSNSIFNENTKQYLSSLSACESSRSHDINIHKFWKIKKYFKMINEHEHLLDCRKSLNHKTSGQLLTFLFYYYSIH